MLPVGGGVPLARNGGSSTSCGSGMRSARGSEGGGVWRRGSVMGSLLSACRGTSPLAGSTRHSCCRCTGARQWCVQAAQRPSDFSQNHRGDRQGKALVMHSIQAIWYYPYARPSPTVPHAPSYTRPGRQAGALAQKSFNIFFHKESLEHSRASFDLEGQDVSGTFVIPHSVRGQAKHGGC